MVDIRTGPIIHDSFVYVSMGMYVSMKEKDNKTVMEHKKHDNLISHQAGEAGEGGGGGATSSVAPGVATVSSGDSKTGVAKE